MNGQIFPLFENAHILRTPMLTQLRDYAFEYGRLLHEGFSNGIVSGCAITTTMDTVTLNRGVIRYHDQMYLIAEPITLTYAPTDAWTVFKLIFKDESRRDSYIYRAVEAKLSDDINLSLEEIELCRFKLQSGARLRTKYVDFADRNTEFDTVNTIFVPYSVCGDCSLSPQITRAFAEEALCWRTEAIDEAFILQALGTSGPLNRKAIAYYIAAKLKKALPEGDNLELYEGLLAILRTLQNGEEREIARDVRRRRHIIVD